MAEKTETSPPFIQRLLSNYIGNSRTVIAFAALSSSCCISGSLLDLSGAVQNYLRVKGEAETTIAESQYCKPVIDDVIGENVPEVYCDMGDHRYYLSIDGKTIEDIHPPKTLIDTFKDDVGSYLQGCN